MGSWHKLGCLYAPSGEYDWCETHASTPVPLALDDNSYRVFFSTRDAKNRSSIAAVTLHMDGAPLVTGPIEKILSFGAAGSFDDSGATVSQIIEHAGKHRLYYQGWSLDTDMPFRCAIGLAVDEGAGFERHSAAPVIDANEVDPYSLSYPWIMIENGKWRMWYGSHTGIETNGMDMEHVIKYAESRDGIHWERNGEICIPLKAGESGVVRPCVIHDGNIYHMWYSIRIGRKQTYRIGYATSKNGVEWQRRDTEAGIDVNNDANAWDGEMICYPCVFEHKRERYMLYCGNSFGKTGFGLAIYRG